MPAEVGVAYLSVVPSMKGAERTLERQLRNVGVPAADSAGRTMGQRLSASLGEQMDRAGAANGSRLARAMRTAMGRNQPTEQDLGLDNLRRSVEVAEKAMAKAVEQGAAAQAAARAKVAKAQEALTAANAKQAEKVAAAQAAAQEKLAAAERKLASATAAQEAQAAKDQEKYAARRAALHTAHEAALRKVSIAQSELTEATEKYEAGSTQALKAQDKLATAQERVTAIVAEQADLGKAMRDYTVDTSKAEAAQAALAKAQADFDEVMSRTTTTSAEASKAQADLIKAHHELSAATAAAAKDQDELSTNLRDARRAMREHAIAARESADATERSFGAKWGDRIQSAMNRAFSNPKVAAAAGVAGLIAGRAWARGFETTSDSVKPGGSGAMNAMAATVGKMSGLRAVSDMGSTMRDVFSNMDRYAMSAATLGLKIGGLSSAAIGGLGSILSLGAGLKTMGGAALALPAIFTAARVGMYVFNTALADFATVLPDVTADYQALNGVVSKSFWDRAAGPVREAAYTLLPVLRTGLAGVSNAFGGWAVAISSVVSSSQGLSWIGQILENIRGAAAVMGDGIGSAANGLLQLTAVGSTYLPKLGSAFNNLAYSFEGFVQKNAANGNIFRWIDNGVLQLKLFGQTIGSVVGWFGALHQASVAGGGATGFERIAAGAQAVNTALRTPLWQGALTAMFRGAYDSMGLIIGGVKALLPSLAAFMPTLGEIMRLSGETIGAMISSLGDLLAHPAVQGGLISFFTAVRDATTQLAPTAGLLGDAFGAIAETAGALVFAVSGTLDAALRAVAPAFLAISENTQQLIPGLSTIAQTIINGAAPGFKVLGIVIGGIIGVISGAIGWLSQFTGLWKTVGTLAVSVGAGLGVLAIAMKAVSIATSLVRGAILLLNSAMMLNPAVWIAAAIVALGVALYAAYQNIGWFKDAVNAAWAGIRMAAQAVVTWFQTVALPFLQGVLTAIGGFFTWLYQTVIRPVWIGIQAAAQAVVTWFQTVALPLLSSALTALGGFFTWLYRSVIQPVWTGIRFAIALAAGAVMTIFDGIVWVVRNVLGPVFSWLWRNIVVPAFHGIVGAAKTWWAGMQVYFNLLKWIISNVVAPVVTWLWRNVFGPAFRGIAAVAKWAWEHVLKPTFNVLKQGLTWVGDRASALRQRWQLIWSMIRATARAAYDFLAQRVFNPLKQALSWVGDRFSAVRSRIGEIWMNLRQKLFDGYVAIRDRTFGPLKTAVNRVKEAFETAKEGIVKTWDALKDATKKPVEFFVNTVYNEGLRKNVNKVLDKVGLKDKHLPELSLPSGFATGGIIGQGHARGGVLPGYQRRKRDDQLTPMRSGEGVLVPEVVRGIGPSTVHELNAAGNAGGEMAVKRVWDDMRGRDETPRRAIAAGPGTSIFGGMSSISGPGTQEVYKYGELSIKDRGVHSSWQLSRAASWWDKLNIVNVNTKGAGMTTARSGVGGVPYHAQYLFNPPQIQFGSHSGGDVDTAAHEIGHALGLPHNGAGHINSGARSIMDYRFLQSVGGPTTADVQALRKIYPNWLSADSATRGVKGGGGGILDILGSAWTKVTDAFDGAKKKVTEKFPGNVFGALGGGVAGMLAGGVKDKITTWIQDKIDAGGDTINNLLGRGDMNGREKGAVPESTVSDWMTTALKKKGLFSEANLRSGINRARKESNLDPGAINRWDVNWAKGDPSKGLMQVIGSTFNQYKEPGYGDIWRGLDNILASINYTVATWGSLAAGWNRPGGYAVGGVVGDRLSPGHPGGPSQRVLGALSPRLHDQGGLIEPGISLIENRTGKPEQSLNPAQTQAWLKNTEIVSEIVRSGDGMAPQITVNVSAREGEDGTKLGNRIGERLAFKLQEVGV